MPNELRNPEKVAERAWRAAKRSILASVTHPDQVAAVLDALQTRMYVAVDMTEVECEVGTPAAGWVGPCPCECNSGGFCGGCGHAGCGGRR